ncbi:hypothetical protein [Arthrobacter rhombi]|uniref:hypothetical protein n=1 Tax=Arthrobacter rhombi TaxID=71253 RepID=UPI003FD0A657
MTSTRWLPLGAETETSALYEVLHEDVPPWMSKSLMSWLQETLSVMMSDKQNAVNNFHRIEQDLRVAIPLSGSLPQSYISSVITHFMPLKQGLTLTDYLLSRTDLEMLDQWGGLTSVLKDKKNLFGKLDHLLSRSGSAWRVGLRYTDALGLVRRVPAGVQSAVDAAIDSGGRAGATLGLAWSSAFGLSPNPREAYRLAIEAVEDAAIPEMDLASGTKPTLGTVIRKINGPARSAEEWTLPLQREDDHYSNGQTVVAMLKSLWAGQVDRHGGGHEQAPKVQIDQSAAETAVLLAVPLVQWFTSGAIRQKQADD